MPIETSTLLSTISLYLTEATVRPTFLSPMSYLSAPASPATLMAHACDTFSSDLARQLRSQNPVEQGEALHAIASSEDLLKRVASRLTAEDRAAISWETSRLEGVAQGRGLDGLKFVFFGDIHDNWGAVRKIVKHECAGGNAVVLGVGDLETYKPIPIKVPFLFSHGNHEDEARMKEIRKAEPEWGQPYPLYPGEYALIQGGLTMGTLSGIYEKDYFEAGYTGVFPYFSQEDVTRMLQIPFSLDLFLSHEAPAGIGLLKKTPRDEAPRDVGCPIVTKILEKLQPQVALFGHHHMDFDGFVGQTRVIGLDYPKRSYVTATVDEASGKLQFERHRSKAVEKEGGRVYQYDWELKNTDESERSGRRRLFSIGMTNLMSREEEAAKILDRDFRNRLKDRLVPLFLPRVGQPSDNERTKQMLAESLAFTLFNTALPYFARYYVSLKSTFSAQEKERLRESLLRQMLKDQPSLSYARNDLSAAFRELAALIDAPAGPKPNTP